MRLNDEQYRILKAASEGKLRRNEKGRYEIDDQDERPSKVEREKLMKMDLIRRWFVDGRPPVKVFLTRQGNRVLQEEERLRSLGPHSVPMNRNEAIALAQKWASGDFSRLNEMLEVESSPEKRQETLVNVARADTAEVEKFAAMAMMFPSEDDLRSLRFLLSSVFKLLDELEENERIAVNFRKRINNVKANAEFMRASLRGYA